MSEETTLFVLIVPFALLTASVCSLLGVPITTFRVAGCLASGLLVSMLITSTISMRRQSERERRNNEQQQDRARQGMYRA
jgi:small neutral amino acid transporter SnatA (MarC family)